MSISYDAVIDQPRDWWLAMKRGMRLRCPNCGEGKMFRAYLKPNDACPHCGEELHHHRADDFPPYVTMVIVGHIVVAALLLVEDHFPGLPVWLHMIGWTALSLVLCLAMLPPVKGALIGLQWALRMHGFGTAIASRNLDTK